VNMPKQPPPDQETSVPEIVPPHTGISWTFQRIAREAPPLQRFKWAALPFAGLFGFILWGFNEFTSLRGWVHVLTSRLILVAMFGAGALMALMFAWVVPIKKRRTVLFVIVAGWGILLFVLDRIAPRPASQTAYVTSIPIPTPLESATPIPSVGPTLQQKREPKAHPSPTPSAAEIAAELAKLVPQQESERTELMKLRADAISVVNGLYGLYSEWQKTDHFWQSHLIDGTGGMSRNGVQYMRNNNNQALSDKYFRDYHTRAVAVRDSLLGHIPHAPTGRS